MDSDDDPAAGSDDASNIAVDFFILSKITSKAGKQITIFCLFGAVESQTL